MQTTTVSNFRKDLKTYIDKVIDDQEILVIPRNADGIVVLSLAEYNSIMETQYLTSTKANREHLSKSIAQIKADKLVKRH